MSDTVVGTEQVPIAPDLFTEGEEPQLIGSRCGACGVVTFPRQSGCARCGAADMRDEPLHRRGTLYTWTTQGFMPKEPYLVDHDRRRRSRRISSATSSCRSRCASRDD